jgi:Xaa-Pro dipeptidase
VRFNDGWEGALINMMDAPTGVQALRHFMEARKLAAVIATSPDNVIYLAGFTVPSHMTNRFRRTLCLVPLQSRPVLIVATVEESLARARTTWIDDVRAYNEFTQHATDVLSEAIEERGLTNACIGIEMDHLPAADYLRASARLPRVSFVPCADVFSQARMVKTPPEIATIRHLAQLAACAHGRAYSQLRPGMAERELSRLLVDACGGVDYVRTIVGSGERSAYANANPTDRRIRRGDVVRVDLIAGLHWFHSDIARTSVVGPPTPEQSRIWSILLDAYRRVQDQLGPGACTQTLHQTYLRALAAGGLDASLEFLGHGLGLTIHEEPYVNKYSNRLLEPGMVLCIEPVYLVPGRMGFHVEDEFLITDEGFELLSTGTPNDHLIQIGE